MTAATRDRYGYWAWRVKRCLMKRGVQVGARPPPPPVFPLLACEQDRAPNGKLRPATRSCKQQGFWACTNSKCRVQAACTKTDMACFRPTSPRSNGLIEPYTARTTSALALSHPPPSAVHSSLNTGRAAAAWTLFSCKISGLSAHHDPVEVHLCGPQAAKARVHAAPHRYGKRPEPRLRECGCCLQACSP